MFNLCDPSALDDESARVSFAGDGVIQLPIQENDPACTEHLCNIGALCAIITDPTRGSEVSAAQSTACHVGAVDVDALSFSRFLLARVGLRAPDTVLPS